VFLRISHYSTNQDCQSGPGIAWGGFGFIAGHCCWRQGQVRGARVGDRLSLRSAIQSGRKTALQVAQGVFQNAPVAHVEKRRETIQKKIQFVTTENRQAGTGGLVLAFGDIRVGPGIEEPWYENVHE